MQLIAKEMTIGSLYRRCNGIVFYMNFSGYVGHLTVFCLMFTIACCLVVGLGLVVYLVSGYLKRLCTSICRLTTFCCHHHTAKKKQWLHV